MTDLVTGDHEDYWGAVQARDERRAYAVAAALRDRGVTVAEVLQHVVMGAQRRVGDHWASNDWTVADEHAATAVSEYVVRRLGADLPAPAPGGPCVLVGCVEREWHALPALVVAESLRSWGQEVTFVGAAASSEGLVGRILDSGPRAVLLSASLSSSLPRVRRQIEAVRGTGTPVIVGGHAFDDAGVRAGRLGATAYAATPEAALDLLATIPHHVTAAPAYTHPGAIEAQTLHAEADVLVRDIVNGADRTLGIVGAHAEALAPDDWRVVLATYVPHVVDCVAGGLLTQDPTVPDDARGWLDEVMHRRGAPEGVVDVLWRQLVTRLREYPQAVRLLEESRAAPER
ncbi:cobalamin B12-binding domain-containing protein [Nocardioides pacificus]